MQKGVDDVLFFAASSYAPIRTQHTLYYNITKCL